MADQADIRICFVGDSFVNGTGDPECLGWTGRICAAASHNNYNVTYYNLGIRRETSADIRDRWQQEVERRLPASCDRRVVFSFGVNDTTIENGKPRVDPSDSIKNARQILTEARRSLPVLMVGPPPIADAEQNQRIIDLSGQLGALCQGLEVPFLEIAGPLRNSEVWISEAIVNDGAHPRAAGYAELAELVQSWSAWRGWFPDRG
ncbi:MULTISPECIES: GDSL-type esterase/lipase family protein [Trichocoleus]|uniref:GDSL-type esterase/lipase family protein n=1 Tax=Trichocoleus desertorum GB2-A4 TaxID=2933944 RepID=A0ABV0J434_9CYAN|nr:GDSL-type esterase/lipase family protein [Trichocoleus sp. FACHB-46]MBD1860400.1 lipase [Trichocoleus sp. FACHB-46]